MNYEIEKYSPCKEALEFRSKFSSFTEAWEACPRGDWMLWIAKISDVDEKLMFKAKALCAKTVLHLMKDDRSKAAVQAALDYSDGKITREELRAAAAAAADAYAAAAAADAYAAAAAADAYAYAADADAADAAAYAAYAAADAAAYAYAYAADADAAARKKNQQETADICRDILTEAVLEKLNLEKQ